MDLRFIAQNFTICDLRTFMLICMPIFEETTKFCPQSALYERMTKILTHFCFQTDHFWDLRLYIRSFGNSVLKRYFQTKYFSSFQRWPSVRLGDFLGVGPPIWTKPSTSFLSCIHFSWTITSTNSNKFRRIKLLHLRTSAYKVKE